MTERRTAGRTVLISGAGIAGPALAYWLRAGGFEPTVVERAPALRTDVFHQLTGGRFLTLGRSDLSRILLDEIAGTTEVLFGSEIVSLDEQPGEVRVELSGGRERRFDLVIGADGLDSGVRERVFGSRERFEKSLGYAVGAFEVRGYDRRDEDVYVVYGEPRRMLARVELHGDRTLFLLVFASAPGEQVARLDLDARKDVLLRHFAGTGWESDRILAQLESATNVYLDRMSQIRMDAWSRGRIALVGDAAFCVSFAAGQGTALALTSAYVLAGELLTAGGDHAVAFRRYEDRLRAFIAGKQHGAERFASAFAPRTRWGLGLRNLVVRHASTPGLARTLLRGGIADGLKLPQYPWPGA